MQAGTGDRIFYRLNSATDEVDITDNLTGKGFWEVSDNWQGMRYVLTNEGIVYKRSLEDAAWTATGISGARLIDAEPHISYIATRKLVYVMDGSNVVKRADIDGSNVETLGDPDPGNPANVSNIAVSDERTVWATKGNRLYRFTGTYGVWVEEKSALNLTHLTAGPRGMLRAALAGGEEGFHERPSRIFFRTHTGEFIDDERIDNRISFNTSHAFHSNSVLLNVSPGTYTIHQDAVDGWHTTDIRLYETTSLSAFTISSATAVIVVSENEVVHVEFENQLTQSSLIASSCIDQAFKEDFGTFNPSTGGGMWGSPLLGQTSYHKATSDFGYGYYALVTNANVVNYGTYLTDKTTGDGTGRMLLVDAGYEKGTFYRRRFTGLINNAKYNFSAWIANVNKYDVVDKPNVSFELYRVSDGQLIASVSSGNIVEVGKWINQTMIFTSTGEDIELVLRNNTTGTRGNDLAIDDISFSLSIPEPEVTITAACDNDGTITVVGPLSTYGVGDNVFEYSIDGSTWQAGTVFENLSVGSYTVHVRYKNAPESCEASIPVEVEEGQDCESLPVTLIDFTATQQEGGDKSQLDDGNRNE